MSAYQGVLACLRCGRQVGEREAFAGCTACRAEGVAANVHPVYRLDEPVKLDEGARGLFRYRPLLPLADGTEPVSLDEGGTPLVPAHRLGAAIGVERLLVKDETRNPTWSYKDRLAAVAVTKARELAVDTVVVATTGNHGAAAAAYAAAAGLRCVALTLRSVPQTMKVLMQAYGAHVVALERGPDRWHLMEQAVAERGWMPLSGFCDPPVGSNPFGIDGYKTIAYELADQLGAAPDVVVVPAAYGDGLAGIFRGFADLSALGRIERLPRLVAAEPFGPYEAALAAQVEVSPRVDVTPSVAFSTATPIGTYQGIRAVRDSGGAGSAVPADATILEAQLRLAREEGLYLEAAAALGVPAIAQLVAAGTIEPTATVVLVATSTGLKDIGATAGVLPDVPVIPPDLGALEAVLTRMDR